VHKSINACKFKERMIVELKAINVEEFRSKDTLVVSLQKELKNSIELI
jgi:hypothetical protein